MIEIPVGEELGPIVIGAQGDLSIIQNIRIILSTVKGSVPLDREFGISAGILDQPEPTAQALLTAEVIQAVNKWEPRVRVSDVQWRDQDLAGDGRLFPVVKIEKL